MQNVMVVLCAAILATLWWLYFPEHTSIHFCEASHVEDQWGGCISLWGEAPFVSLFVLLCLFNASSDLFSMASSIAVERDWVVVLCAEDQELLSSE